MDFSSEDPVFLKVYKLYPILEGKFFTKSVAYTHANTVYNILVSKPLPLGRPMYTREHNIKLDLEEMQCDLDSTAS
jgi:hypothetical protein